MIWIFLIIIILIISFYWTKFSLRNFEHRVTEKLPYSLFLIRSKTHLKSDVLNVLYSFSKSHDTFFSLEILLKGEEKALCLFAPSAVTELVPQLHLLELEEYVDDKNHSFAWQLEPVAPENPAGLDLELTPDQLFFLQFICKPSQAGAGKFSTSVRALIREKDAITRIELAKKVNGVLESNFGLKKLENKELGQSTGSLFDSFKDRTFPSSAHKNVLNSSVLVDIVAKD